MIRNCYIAHMGPSHAGEYCDDIVILEESDGCQNGEMKADSGLVSVSLEGGGSIPNVFVLSTHQADEIEGVVRIRPALTHKVIRIVGIYPEKRRAA